VQLPAIFIAVFVGIATFAGMLTLIYAKGIRTARIATLVPTVLAMAFILKAASPAIDAKNSERPVAQKLSEIAPSSTPVAVANVSRVVEYGLNFYRNQPIANYDRGEVPMGTHIVVAKPGAEKAIESLAHGRQVTDVGGFKAQALEFYYVSAYGKQSGEP
jgi:hypothetical protein